MSQDVQVWEPKQIALVSLAKSVTKKQLRFLRDLYCTSRDEEIATVDWPAKQIKTFLHAQFELQQKHYTKTYPQSLRQLIHFNGQPIGRLYLNHDQLKQQIHLIDITILPEYRKLGIGAHLMTNIITQAKAINWQVSLYVSQQKQALSWYKTMGFKVKSVENGYHFMTFEPE